VELHDKTGSVSPRRRAGKSRSPLEAHAPWLLELLALEFPNDEPFAAIIRCTSDPGKADKRTRSKWSRVLRYALEYKPVGEPLAAFVQRKGGINKCAARFPRCLGRGGRS
jgi:hypothetical protein